MDVYVIIFLSVALGGILAAGSVVLGAWLFSRAAASDSSGFLAEPKGDVFTIETPDDGEMFPDDNEGEDENEKHILERTNKFLDAMGGKG